MQYHQLVIKFFIMFSTDVLQHAILCTHRHIWWGSVFQPRCWKLISWSVEKMKITSGKWNEIESVNICMRCEMHEQTTMETCGWRCSSQCVRINKKCDWCATPPEKAQYFHGEINLSTKLCIPRCATPIPVGAFLSTQRILKFNYFDI